MSKAHVNALSEMGIRFNHVVLVHVLDQLGPVVAEAAEKYAFGLISKTDFHKIRMAEGRKGKKS